MESENQNMNEEPVMGRYSPNSFQANQYEPQMSYEPAPAPGTKKRRGLAIASLILGGISMLCCWAYGIGIVPALIGFIFGLIALISGRGATRVMGGIGFGVSLIGIALSVFMIITYAAIIDWGNLTMENFMSIQNIDPNNRQEVMEWLQQFFNVDITSFYYYG